MKDILHKFLVYCGVALVMLRFVPAKPDGFLSRLFFDDTIHTYLDRLSVKIILSLGVTIDQYQTQAAQLGSLAHAFALIAQALGIGLVFFVITRWI